MSRLRMTISMSLDGYSAGPDPSLDDPLAGRYVPVVEAAWPQPAAIMARRRRLVSVFMPI